MLRVGLTGGLGSGKSTAAALFSGLGAHVFQSDTIGRELMQPGQPVYAAIAAHFGPGVVLQDGTLDRTALAQLAFAEGRVEQLNAIVHPAVIAQQAALCDQLARAEPNAVVIVESALIFETRHASAKTGKENPAVAEPQPDTDPPAKPWHTRFDRLILVTAPEELKIRRFVSRLAAGQPLPPARREELEAEARRRLDQQLSDEHKAALCDYVLINAGPLSELEWQVDQLWPILHASARHLHTVPASRYNR
ncbi:MAG: dephospho-CoA kinase [Acidobacteriota bacterium]|nr:dephospho-CoA kinase [Acidobacteriota bacterium]